jgi:lipopolysaccharide export system permease protein
MYRDSEMVIWFAGGVGITRFVRPVLRMAWPVLLVVACCCCSMSGPGATAAARTARPLRARSDLSRVAPGVFQSPATGAASSSWSAKGADNQNARNVFILSNLDHQEVVTSARTATSTEGEDRLLVLDRGQRSEIDTRSGDYTLSSFETYRVLAGQPALRPRLPGRQRPRPGHADLLRQDTPRNQGELAWRIGMLLGAANLLLLGIGLAATNPRRPATGTCCSRCWPSSSTTT